MYKFSFCSNRHHTWIGDRISEVMNRPSKYSSIKHSYWLSSVSFIVFGFIIKMFCFGYINLLRHKRLRLQIGGESTYALKVGFNVFSDGISIAKTEIRTIV
jgi:hypothetical protein